MDSGNKVLNIADIKRDKKDIQPENKKWQKMAQEFRNQGVRFLEQSKTESAVSAFIDTYGLYKVLGDSEGLNAMRRALFDILKTVDISDEIYEKMAKISQLLPILCKNEIVPEQEIAHERVNVLNFLQKIKEFPLPDIREELERLNEESPESWDIKYELPDFGEGEGKG